MDPTTPAPPAESAVAPATPPPWVQGKPLAIALGISAVVAAGAVGLLAAVGLFDTPADVTPRGTALERAVTSCASAVDGAHYLAEATTGDGGHTLTLTDKTSTQTLMTCVLQRLRVSASVVGTINQTRALDGMVSGDWSGYHATWTYHPKHGVHMVITTS